MRIVMYVFVGGCCTIAACTNFKHTNKKIALDQAAPMSLPETLELEFGPYDLAYSMPTLNNNELNLPTYEWLPDGTISSIRSLEDPSKWYIFWPEFENFRSLSNSPFPDDSLRLDPEQAVFGHRTAATDRYDNGGSWLMPVLRLDANKLIGFFHAEDHFYPKNDRYIAWKSIGVSYSSDEGAHWEEGNTIITTHGPRPSQPRWGGAGDHTIVWDEANKRWFCLFYENDMGSLSDGIRAAVSYDRLARPGTWYKYYEDSFSQPGLGGHSTDIVGLERLGAFSPSLHWNTYLEKWVLIYTAKHSRDLWITYADDLLTWDNEHVPLPTGSQGEARYPTLIGSDHTTAGQRAKLYFGIFDETTGKRRFLMRSLVFNK